LRLLMWLYLLPVPISLAINHQAVIYPIHFLTLSVITFEMLVGVYLCWRRQRSAYFFMLAYSVLITVASINLLAGIGVIPLPWDMGWSMQLASAVEMLLLSFALADRMRQVHRERDHSKYWAAQFQTQLIDELRNSENRLKVMVAQRIDELRRLIDMLSHEIRTPMSVIRMYLSMSQPTIHNHAQAQQAVHDVDSIIERCLEVDQIERDSVTIKQQLLQVDAIVRQFASTHLESERISVSAPQCCEVATDEQILKILLSNLIDNALKYSPPEGRVEIFVSIKKVDYQPGISVLVSNQIGPVGLPDPTQIFKKYYRSSRAHGKSGSGLGLYLVQQFAQLLGGKANYHFDDRQVHFEIWIPAHRASNFSPNPQ
jgi:signal transduction histidine kinase